MANLDEDGPPVGDGDRNGEANGTPPADGGSRLHELERENARLRAELADLRIKHQISEDVIAGMIRRDLPDTEEEFLRGTPGAPTISDLVRKYESGHNP